MAGETLYLKADRNIEVTGNDVFLKDIATITCSNKHIVAKVKAIKIYHFRDSEKPRVVISILKIIELIQSVCPDVTVDTVGEADVILEKVKEDKKKGPIVWLKILFVSCISFFGTAFTIMAFHNDIDIQNIFGKFYMIVTGQESNGFTALEVSYSIGLAIGIIVFFNHIGGRRITKDPTPIEVAMRSYENDVNTTLIETAGREGKEWDAS